MPSLKYSFLILVIAEFLYNVSSYIINMGLGRMLSVSDYGRYSLVIGFTTMVIILVGRGVPTAMAKRISEHRDNWAKIHAIRTSAAHMQIIIIGTLTLLFYCSAPLFARIFHDVTLVPLFRLSACIIPAFALSSFHVLYFNGLKLFGAMTAMKISRGVFRIAWILGLAYTMQLSGAIYGSILAPLSVFCIALFIEYVFLRKKSVTVHNTYPWKKLLSYAGGFIVFLVFYELYIRCDLYIIKTLTGSDQSTGLYNAALTIALIPYYVMFALTFILFPTMSELAKKKDTENIKKTLTKVLGFLCAVLIPSALLLTLLPEFLITLFFGEKFIAAAALIPWMSGATIFITIFYVLASVFNGAGMTRVPSSIAAVAVVCGLSANIYFLPTYGITATAIIFSCTATFMGCTALLIAYKTFFRPQKTTCM